MTPTQAAAQLEFERFLKNAGVTMDDPLVPLFRQTWNKAIATAIQFLVATEGIKFGLLDFKIPD